MNLLGVAAATVALLKKQKPSASPARRDGPADAWRQSVGDDLLHHLVDRQVAPPNRPWRLPASLASSPYRRRRLDDALHWDGAFDATINFGMRPENSRGVPERRLLPQGAWKRSFSRMRSMARYPGRLSGCFRPHVVGERRTMLTEQGAQRMPFVPGLWADRLSY